MTPDFVAAIRAARELMDRCGAPGAFIGAIAVNVWGAPRASTDVDLVLDLAGRVDALVAAARQGGYTVDAEELRLLDDGGFLRLTSTVEHRPFDLDVLTADTPFHKSAVARAVEVEFAGVKLPVISAEDLILMKLVAFRPKDTFDLDNVVDARRGRLDLAYLRDWADRLQVRGRLEAYLEEQR